MIATATTARLAGDYMEVADDGDAAEVEEVLADAEVARSGYAVQAARRRSVRSTAASSAGAPSSMNRVTMWPARTAA